MNKKAMRIFIILMAAIMALLPLLGQEPSASASSLEQAQQQAADNAQSMEDYRQQQRELAIELERLADEKEEQAGLADSFMVQISYLESQMIVIQEQLALTEQAIAEAESQISRAETAIADAETRLAERQALLEQRLVSLYMYGEISLLDVIFETDSFEDFLVVYDMTQRIMNQDQELLADIEREKEIITTQKAMLESSRDELVSLQHDQMDQQAELLYSKNQYYAALDEANIKLAELEAEEDAFEAAQQAIGDQIRSLLASSNSLLTFGGVLGWPLPSGCTYVTSPFGYRTHPVYGTTRYHAGIDIAADGGTAIFAAADGEILFVGWQDGYGNTVMIDHGNSMVTLYGHQSAFGDFSSGDMVIRGDTIGYVGSTGVSTGNHLHFEVRQNGSAVDPWNYLNP